MISTKHRAAQDRLFQGIQACLCAAGVVFVPGFDAELAENLLNGEVGVVGGEQQDAEAVVVVDGQLATIFREGIVDLLAVEVDVCQFAVGVDGTDEIRAEASDGVTDGSVGEKDVLLQVSDGRSEEI